MAEESTVLALVAGECTEEHSPMPHVRRVLRLLPAIVGILAAASAFAPSPASASCMTGAVPTAEISGIVVSTSIQRDWGVFVEVHADDGTTRSVLFGGRNPDNTLSDGSENTVEDAWNGELPEVGGRYAITGGEFDGPTGPLSVNMCAESASVEVLSSPPSAVAPTTDDVGAAASGSTSSGTMVAALLGAAAVVVLVAVLLRRRSTSAGA